MTRAWCPVNTGPMAHMETEMKVNIGKGIELDVDVTKLGFAAESAMTPVARHVVYLGLRNPLMDSHAGITTDETDYVAKSRAQAEKKLEAMYNGEVRTAGTREGDPVKAEARRLAVRAVEAAIKKAGKKVKDVDRKAITEKANTVLERFLEQAKKNVDSARAADIDLDGITIS